MVALDLDARPDLLLVVSTLRRLRLECDDRIPASFTLPTRVSVTAVVRADEVWMLQCRLLRGFE